MKLKHRILVNLINLIASTWRIKLNGSPILNNGIIAFWHGQMLPVWKAFSNNYPIGIVSKSKDGEVLTHLLQKWNFELIRGSSSHDGKQVLEQAIRLAKTRLILMTPDGPRGPIHLFKSGAVVAAVRSNSPLYLCGVRIKRKWVSKASWDRFEVPLPFSNIELYIAKAELPKNDTDRDGISQAIENCRVELITLSEKK